MAVLTLQAHPWHWAAGLKGNSKCRVPSYRADSKHAQLRHSESPFRSSHSVCKGWRSRREGWHAPGHCRGSQPTQKFLWRPELGFRGPTRKEAKQELCCLSSTRAGSENSWLYPGATKSSAILQVNHIMTPSTIRCTVPCCLSFLPLVGQLKLLLGNVS